MKNYKTKEEFLRDINLALEEIGDNRFTPIEVYQKHYRVLSMIRAYSGYVDECNTSQMCGKDIYSFATSLQAIEYVKSQIDYDKDINKFAPSHRELEVGYIFNFYFSIA